MSERGAYKLYSYVLAHDSGFVPNSFGSYYTLACCKPKIRKNTKIGDWIVGTGSKRNVGNVRLIYVIGVTKKITFEQYANDGRFTSKIPSQGVIEEEGITSITEMQMVCGFNGSPITLKNMLLMT